MIIVFVDGDASYATSDMEDAEKRMFDDVKTYIGEVLKTDELLVTIDLQTGAHTYTHKRDNEINYYVYTTQSVNFYWEGFSF